MKLWKVQSQWSRAHVLAGTASSACTKYRKAVRRELGKAARDISFAVTSVELVADAVLGASPE